MDVIIDGVKYVPEEKKVVHTINVVVDTVDNLSDIIGNKVKEAIEREQRPGGLLNRNN